MRVVWFMPMAFLAGADGLILLIPYIVFMATLVGFKAGLKQRRRLAPRLAVTSLPTGLELESAAL